MDQYALGVVAYHLLTGTIPFQADDPIALVTKHLTDTPRPLRAYRPELSKELEAVVLRMLAKAPCDRYPDVPTARQALAEAGLCV